MKKAVDECVEITTLVLPIGWVIACYDGATRHLLADDFIRFFGHVFAACVVSFFLLWVGLRFSGLTLKTDEADPLSLGRWKALGIEILILLWITFYLLSKK